MILSIFFRFKFSMMGPVGCTHWLLKSLITTNAWYLQWVVPICGRLRCGIMKSSSKYLEPASSSLCSLLFVQTVFPFYCLKVVLEGCCRCPDSHDLSAYCHLYDLGRQKSSPSYKLNNLNFDFEKLSVETLWDHLNLLPCRVLSRHLAL